MAGGVSAIDLSDAASGNGSSVTADPFKSFPLKSALKPEPPPPPPATEAWAKSLRLPLTVSPPLYFGPPPAPGCLKLIDAGRKLVVTNAEGSYVISELLSLLHSCAPRTCTSTAPRAVAQPDAGKASSTMSEW